MASSIRLEDARAPDAGQAKTCAPSTPSLAQRRHPGQDEWAQHLVPGAAHSVRKNARNTSRADTQFQARAPKHPNAPDAAEVFSVVGMQFTMRILNSMEMHKLLDTISAREQNNSRNPVCDIQ